MVITACILKISAGKLGQMVLVSKARVNLLLFKTMALLLGFWREMEKERILAIG